MAVIAHNWRSTTGSKLGYETIDRSNAISQFMYAPLDVSSPMPSFRLAILHPGTPTSTVRINLAHTKFADRPSYEALSYTWGSPGVVKGIEINGWRVDVRENLWSALVHLRSETNERGLWVDAICINQADIDERNNQVKQMAHIYKRARAVLVWLGVVHREVGFEQMKPATRILNTKWSYDDMLRYEWVCNQPYWKRLWIVQEIGAATELMVHWGKLSTTWETFSTIIKECAPENIDFAWKLIQQRTDRHGNGFLLANLIEAFHGSLCEEPRDKIYGFVGIAHDCEDGSFPVDYSKSLFELYEDMINFQNSSTKAGLQLVRDEEQTMTKEEMEDMEKFWLREAKSDAVEDPNSIKWQKSKAALHFSQLVQKALGGKSKMHDDFVTHHPEKKTPFYPPFSTEIQENFHPFTVRGVHSGNISSIGPLYSEIIGIPDSSRKWNGELSKSKGDVDKLRIKNEGFMRVLLSLNRLDAAKVVNIDSHFSWRRTNETPQAQNSTSTTSKLDEPPKFLFKPAGTLYVESIDKQSEAEPRLFLTRTGVLGLMPSGARQWDRVYQFWHCDSVAIIRREGDYLRLVGRGVVANDHFVEKVKFQEPDDEFDGFSFDADGEELFMG